MRYDVQRIRTGEWLYRDLPLNDGERTRELSGPGQITGKVPPGMRDVFHTDGLRIIEDWASAIYAIDNDNRIVQAGLVVPTTGYDDDGVSCTFAGFSTYPQGYIYTQTYNWGPFIDPVRIYRDHWDWIQNQPQSDIGIEVVGDLSSSAKVGNNAEPYALAYYDQPDLGQEMDTLAAQAPFDYVEEHEWTSDQRESVHHRVRLGVPRLGRDRTDLHFVEGVNIGAPVVGTTSAAFANDVIALGNGEGIAMKYGRAAVDDGRLRRTKFITDKTVTRQAQIDAMARDHLMRLSATLDVSEVVVMEHPSAPIGAIALGDDILIEFNLPGYGPVKLKVRVLAITQSDADPGYATLATARSNAFVYSATVEGLS